MSWRFRLVLCFWFLCNASEMMAADIDSSNSSALAEIVVTAEKRSENLENVPIAITALTADTLRIRGISDVHGMSQLSPNVNLDAGAPFSGSSAVLSASIRGIGQDDFGFNLDPGVGVYLDGVYLARTVGSNITLPDVERVEILKGPQGTLFGRNSIGGAINVVTHEPGTTPSFDFQATTGSYSRRDFQATGDMPISDTLLSTLTVASAQRDGYQRRIPLPGANDYVYDALTTFPQAGYKAYSTAGGQNEQVVRGKLVWNATVDLKATIAADYTHHDQSATPQTVLDDGEKNAFNFFNIYNACINLSPAQAAGAGLSLICSNRSGAGSILGANLTPATARLTYNSAAYMTGNVDTSYATGLNFDIMDAEGTAATVDWHINDLLALKSISSYRHVYWRSGIDQDGSPVDGLDLSFLLAQQQTSQEFQLLGNAFDERLNYVAGLYYFNENGHNSDHVIYPAGILQISGINFFDTTSYATFVHADFKMTELFSATLGGRYSIDHKSIAADQTDLNGFAYKISGCYPPQAPATAIGAPAITCQQALGYPNPLNPLQAQPAVKDYLSFDEFTPTAGLQAQWTPDLMTYVSYSRGFKSGGWTTRLTNPVTAQPTFGPETANTYEVGLKSQWLDRQVVANLAAFLTHYKGIQLNFFQAVSPIIENGGNANILGLELETKASLSKAFNIRFNVGYLDDYYTAVNSQTGLTLEDKLPKTPKWKLNLGPEYDVFLPNRASVRLILDYTHTTSLFNDPPDTLTYERPVTNTLDLSATYVTPAGQYEISAGGTNVTDDRYLTTASGATSTVDVGTYNPPAEWYLRFRAHF